MRKALIAIALTFTAIGASYTGAGEPTFNISLADPWCVESIQYGDITNEFACVSVQDALDTINF